MNGFRQRWIRFTLRLPSNRRRPAYEWRRQLLMTDLIVRIIDDKLTKDQLCEERKLASSIYEYEVFKAYDYVWASYDSIANPAVAKMSRDLMQAKADKAVVALMMS